MTERELDHDGLLIQHHNVGWDPNDSQDKLYHYMGSSMTLVAFQDLIGNVMHSSA
jgi:hypothetical protein